jgi:sulfur transfer protein SufE
VVLYSRKAAPEVEPLPLPPLHSPFIQTPLVRSAAATGVVPASLQAIVGSFQAVPDPMQRYKQLLFFATKLAPRPAEDHVPENKVQGCVSQVWVVPSLGGDGRITWAADSDSQLTKVGLGTQRPA